MEGEIKNLVKVWLSILSSLCYCYFLASKIPKGKRRLLSLLPILFLFTILPFYLTYVFPIGLVALFFSWLGNFKLLLFAFDKGPLSSHPPYSLVHFILIASLPIKIKENKKYPSPQIPQSPQISSPKHPKLPLNWPTKVLLFAILVSAHDHMQFMHQKIVLLLYCCMVYLLIDIIFGISNGLVRSVSEFELESPSNEPYLSTSLQDFWGKRWNLMVTNLLRHTIYKPVRLFSDNLLGSKWAPLAAVLVAFLVSGLMHELLFYYIIRVSPTWEVTWYFLLHGACVVMEFGVKRVFSGKLQLHWAVSALLTVGFVVATAMWLFFPPLLRTGVVQRAIEECKILLYFAKVLLKVKYD
ncbi:probable long-chain-alcohol O-fatty-acyltransferase 1 [Durio zibethinus]|uniref:Probable long-chain-alcohol O-fatty-acyltransferase 1 n=1 Tax=Durio zibethinus TaxID=66656 RepID=A0A6P5Y3D7_DURZI|nr:probable long-chain-alcohol O-fatty-acyltransferase 1 [Durio zibethinus]